MARWLDRLNRDPIPTLLHEGEEALVYFANRDLLGIAVPPVEYLWQLPEAAALLRVQRPDGSWKYGGAPRAEWEDYSLLETYRNVGILVQMYGFTREHPALARAAEFLFSRQTPDGDIRGILGNQTMPYYHGAILERLVQAGYEDDPRVRRGLDWLLDVRQSDGGWLVPTQMIPWKARTEAFWTGPTLPTDPEKPSAHMATGMAIRALALHPDYNRRPEVTRAGEFLAGRLFKPDAYGDRQAVDYWFKFQYPFWWTNLVTALDSLARLGFTAADPRVRRGLEWFVENQEQDGLWFIGYGSGRKAKLARVWVGLAICRVLDQYELDEPI